MQTIKQHLVGFIVGALVVIFAFNVYILWTTRNIAVDAEAKANAIIDLINKAQKNK